MKFLKNTLAIFSLGAAGALCRYYLLGFQGTNITFPYMLLIINALAAFFVGVLYYKLAILKKNYEYLYTGILVGFFGSFSTISATLTETYLLYTKGDILLSIIHASLNVILGILVCKFGVYLATKKTEKI